MKNYIDIISLSVGLKESGIQNVLYHSISAFMCTVLCKLVVYSVFQVGCTVMLLYTKAIL